MRPSDDLVAGNDVALAAAGALERTLGEDVVLTVGTKRESIAEVLPEEGARVIAMHFTAGEELDGLAAVVVGPALAELLERAASDEILVTAVAPAVETAARAYGREFGLDVEVEHAEELDLTGLAEADARDVNVVYPILDGDDVVACIVMYARTADLPDVDMPATATPGLLATSQSAADAFVLADVEMGVTAELGRCRMSVRELLSITPGTVVDLDRPAGAPVDVLVNGTLIARGEVVVIDEEFGIRITEIIPQAASAR